MQTALKIYQMIYSNIMKDNYYILFRTFLLRYLFGFLLLSQISPYVLSQFDLIMANYFIGPK